MCTPEVTEVVSGMLFQCNCSGTGFIGPTCNRGVLTTPSIPTLIEDQSSSFNISARPPSEIVVELSTNSKGVQVQPREVVLDQQHTVGTFEVSGNAAGHYTLNYNVMGSIADSFEMPENTPVLVSRLRPASQINRYFTTVGTEPGSLAAGCCRPGEGLVYSECPMSTDPVSFRSTCSWSSDKEGIVHETSGVVFTEYRNLVLPLAISGVSIEYDGSAISTSRSTQSYCRDCFRVKGSIFDKTPLDSQSCTFFSFDSSDVEDILNSNSLANTFMEGVTSFIPSWFKATIPTNFTTSSGSFVETDFVMTLAKQEDVSSLLGCEDVVADDPGLYIVLRYGRGFDVTVDGGRSSVGYGGSGNAPVCVAINLCREMTSPLYMGLPPHVQPLAGQLMEPCNREGWQCQVTSVALYGETRSLEAVSDTYWNGTEYYSPQLPHYDLRMNAVATASFESSGSGHISVGIDCQGSLFNFFPDMDVSICASHR